MHYTSYRDSENEGAAGEHTVPEMKEVELINHRFPNLSISEDYRTVRTSLLLSHADKPPKTIMFSSAIPQEGKTASVSNMAVSFAQLKERVLIVDADLRKPRIHRIFNVDNSTGLSGYLTGKTFIRNAIQKSFVDNVWVLPSGLIPPNPAELLNSKKMGELIEVVEKGYDVVLIDTPPVLAVVDSVIVSALVDGTVFVVKAGKTTHKIFQRAIEELKKTNSHIFGVLFNELKIGKGEYYYMDYYRYSRPVEYYESEDTLEDQ